MNINAATARPSDYFKMKWQPKSAAPADRVEFGNDHSSHAADEAAVQYLVWGLEEIEKSGNKEAARHARMALKALHESASRSDDQTGEHVA